MNRRFFLKGAGGIALAAPFLPSLAERTANAATKTPRRSVIFHAPCGRLTDRWFPKVENGPLDPSALGGTTIEALTPYVRKLLVPRGLRSLNSYAVTQSIDPHDQAMGSKLTCAPIDANNQRYPTSFSLDHEIARQLNPAGRGPLVLSVATMNSTSVKNLVSYAAPLTPNIPLTDPSVIYAALMGLPAASPPVDYLRRRRLSVLDLVRDDLQSYQRLKMSTADQRRVSNWLELLRQTETKLGTPSCNDSTVGIDAAAVKAASPASTAADGFTFGADMMFRLMALTMLCDLNRSLVILFPGYVTFDWDGIHHKVDHDGLCHRTGDFTSGGTCYPDVLNLLTQIDTWYGNKFAKLVGLLDSLPEGDGTLLDNTATVWLQEFSDGAAFNLNNLPILIAGSAGGYLRQGVSVNVGGAPIGPGNSEASCMPGGDGLIHNNTGSTGGNVPINKLYVTLMNAVGCKAAGGGPVTSFGLFDGDQVADGIKNPGEPTALKA